MRRRECSVRYQDTGEIIHKGSLTSCVCFVNDPEKAETVSGTAANYRNINRCIQVGCASYVNSGGEILLIERIR